VFDILPQLLVNALISGSIYALAAAGLALIYGLFRVMNFSHGHMMMVGAYLYYMFNVDLGFSIPAASVLTIAALLVVGYISLEVFVSPMLQLSILLPLISTLALSYILESGVSMAFGVNVKSLSPGSAGQSYEFAGVYITPIQIGIIVSSIFLLSLLAFIVHSTSVGRKIRALREYSFAATSLGTDEKNIRRIMFLLSVLLAGFAGVMVGYETNLQPTMGQSYTIKALSAMILGGLGNIWGTVAGSFLLGLIENLAIGLDFGGYSLPAGYKDAFAFVIILLVLLVKPSGLFNTSSRKA
jgi:branched-chain amino acid transport system permease protein